MSINPLFKDKINFRDLGGYEARDGRKIKPGLLYRSGGLYLMSEEELESFKSLGIKFIMDLRTKQETDKEPDPVFEGIEMVQHSGLTFKGGEEIDFSPVGMSKIGQEGIDQLNALSKYYKMIPFDNEAMRILMDKVVSHDVPLLFHCATGKDRTGTAAIIILSALDIPEETVFEDFMLSNDFHRKTIDKLLKESEERIKEHPVLGELIQMRAGVTENIGRSVLHEIYNRYGSIDEYFLREYGLTQDDLQNLRDFYLE